MAMARRILLIGGSGLIGRQVAARLRGGGGDLRALQRRSTGGACEEVAAPGQWPALVRSLGGDVAISALGTTGRAAGSDAGFRAVDHDMVVAFAAAAREAGVRQMILVSSVGADARSRNFYLRLKGEVEAALRALAFERLDIVRPGLLRGERGKERRPGERLGILVSPLVNLVLRGPLDRFAAIDAAVVADAIAALAGRAEPDTFVHHNRDLLQIAAGIV
jgi:uncharacterized protein YbjT (DUF2867 family)